ncbi:hypothetical protein DPMN_065004 [Dreissena polymorpha]|uniref:Uncharacterized protein n=1 Tax=Dreissena polymorpha TaxID=45954 RepID=A0A9D4CEI7_DREPO|nr:hypothetical protein DPMN_065004 [Dreissena polymorpha]
MALRRRGRQRGILGDGVRGFLGVGGGVLWAEWVGVENARTGLCSDPETDGRRGGFGGKRGEKVEWGSFVRKGKMDKVVIIL